jgi:hypothetical protein
VKRLFVVLSVSLAVLVVGCGGSSSSGPTPPPTPPPTTGFTTASLTGQYALEMSGTDLNGSFIGRVCSFTADGAGNITSAVEDVNDAGSFNIVQFTGGTYTMGGDGRGVLTLNGGAGSGLQLSIALSSTTSGFAVQTDEAATTSGIFDAQTATAFSLPSVTGSYAFDASGGDANLAPLTIIGQFAANGGGGVTGGVLDFNAGSQSAPSGPQTIPASTISTDATFGASNGRGTITLDGLTFAFYIVDGTHLKLIEEDSNGVSVGDAFAQTGTIPTQVAGLTGTFSFLVGGAAVTGNFGSIARAGSAAFSGGNLSAVSLDDNNAGNYTKLTNDAGSYTIDSAGSGRGTFTFVDSSAGAFSYIFYLISPTTAFIEENSAAVIGAGNMSAQPTTISNSALAGAYAFNWSGQTIPSSGNVGFEEDFVGAFSLAASNAISGTVDFTELGSTSTPIFTGVPVTGTFPITGSGSGRNSFQAILSPGSGAPSTTFNFAGYVGAGNTIYLITTDSTRVTAGSAVVQTAP